MFNQKSTNQQMSENQTSNKGSIWRKWDLHLHTPNTKLSDNFSVGDQTDIWKEYIDKLENSDVEAFGITDYFSFENYFLLKEKYDHYYPGSKKVLFPNIEFRLDIAVNKQGEEINLHLIFSNEIEKSQLDDFLTELKTNTTNRSGSKISCKNLEKDQFKSATVNHNLIIECLNSIFGKSKPYIILAAANNAGLRPTNSPRKLSITDEIDKICDAFFGGRQNKEYFLKKDRYESDEISKPKPVICGCDAHSFEDLNDHLGKFVTRKNKSSGKEEIYKDITWIKADLTFEGLKQILFEPNYRVSISERKPRNPIRRVESIRFDFPKNTMIRRKNSSDQQKFCLRRIDTPVFFSDYFTSIIGGRGTGKSTIINLLAEKLNESTEFFKRSELIVDDEVYDIENDENNYISIEGTNEVEFVSQGKIEKLAEGDELTRLIYEERIKEIENEFFEIEKDYNSINEKVEENIKILFRLMKNIKLRKSKEKEKETIQKIIDSINDERYISITEQIKSLKNELTKIELSKTNYASLLESLKRTYIQYLSNNNSNEIDERINQILSTIFGLDEFKDSEEGVIVVTKKFENVEQRIIEINAKLAEQNLALKEFFEEKGTSEETIKDSQKASETLSRITSEIEQIDANNKILKDQHSENLKIINKLPNLYDRNQSLIKENLNDINNKLKVNNENVLDIRFNFEFNEEQYRESLFNEFYEIFREYHISGTSDSRVKEVLFLIEPDFDLINLKYEDFLENLEVQLNQNNYRKINNYVKILFNIFESKGNYLIYLYLIRKHRYNLSRYIKINGFYGNRELQSCSFGQRCTAVIVTLLMTGVKPLIIDEPEAHLDNKLVADYLVNLVKEKQYDRQIIFATHNSNFVINGDSSLIHILNISNDTVFTNKISTTIENLSNREMLLKLEGGREAFLNRENKYGI